jgi:hypothetical protein
MRSKTGNPVGRPPIFKTPEELQKKINEYLKECEEKDNWASKLGFCVFAKVANDCLYELKKKTEFSDTLHALEQLSQETLLQKGLKGQYNSQIVKLIASANYGMRETVENINHNKTPDVIKINIVDPKKE